MDSHTEVAEDNQPDGWTQHTIDQLQSDLNTIEAIISRHLKKPETEEETPPEVVPTPAHSLLRIARRIISALKRYIEEGDSVIKENNSLKKQLKEQQFVLEQVELERDVLLQQVHAYLETNSSLRVRLEEQRCQSGALHHQENANLELRIKSLESEKEKLTESNMEKDKQIHKMVAMLEQTTKCLRNRETEELNRKNEENKLLAALRADLRKALEEKAELEEKCWRLEERLEGHSSGRKRSLSVGDVTRAKVNSLEKHILLEPPREAASSRKRTDGAELDTTLPPPWRLHTSRSWPSSQTITERSKSTPVHTQLNALRRDLVNVTRKLDALKFQLMVSGVIAGEENRSLKRKAKPLETETEDEGISEGHKPDFLRNILQDAKNLNAKLENLREEKQKIIDQNKEKEGRPRTNEREFEKAVSECDGGATAEEEAFAGLVSPVFPSILGRYNEWRRRTDETEGEDGGGDNQLKMHSSSEQCKQLAKLKIDHLKGA